MNAWTFWVCNAHAQLGHDDEAIEWCRKSITVGPLWFAYVHLISAYGWKGQMEEARAASGELKKLMPNYTIIRWMNNGWSDNAVWLKQNQRVLEGLRKAGMPEG